MTASCCVRVSQSMMNVFQPTNNVVMEYQQAPPSPLMTKTTTPTTKKTANAPTTRALSSASTHSSSSSTAAETRDSSSSSSNGSNSGSDDDDDDDDEEEEEEGEQEERQDAAAVCRLPNGTSNNKTSTSTVVPVAPFLIINYFDTLKVLDYDPKKQKLAQLQRQQELQAEKEERNRLRRRRRRRGGAATARRCRGSCNKEEEEEDSSLLAPTTRSNKNAREEEEYKAQELDERGLEAGRGQDWDGALTAWLEALDMRESWTGSSDWNVARTVNNVGLALLRQRRYDDAIYVLEQAVSIQRDLMDDEADGDRRQPTNQHTKDANGTLHNLSVALVKAGRWSEAIARLQAVLDDSAAASSSKTTLRAATLRQLGLTLAAVQQFSAAWEALEKAHAILEIHCQYPPTHPRRVMIRRDMTTIEDVLATRMDLSFSFD